MVGDIAGGGPKRRHTNRWPIAPTRPQRDEVDLLGSRHVANGVAGIALDLHGVRRSSQWPRQALRFGESRQSPFVFGHGDIALAPRCHVATTGPMTDHVERRSSRWAKNVNEQELRVREADQLRECFELLFRMEAVNEQEQSHP